MLSLSLFATVYIAFHLSVQFCASRQRRRALIVLYSVMNALNDDKRCRCCCLPLLLGYVRFQATGKMLAQKWTASNDIKFLMPKILILMLCLLFALFLLGPTDAWNLYAYVAPRRKALETYKLKAETAHLPYAH